MRIDAYLQPNFVEKESQFKNAILIMIDVLRASTTICVALQHEAKEIITIEEVDKAIMLYNNLSRENRFIGGERAGVRVNGFDAGNSPDDYPKEAVQGKTVIFTTTNGTQLFGKCKSARTKFVGAFVNFHRLIEKIKSMTDEDDSINEICIVCAGNEGQLAYEDITCAGAFIEEFKKMYDDSELTDAALVAESSFVQHKDKLYDFVSERQHGKYLKSIGFEKDTNTALQFDTYPIIPQIIGNTIKNME